LVEALPDALENNEKLSLRISDALHAISTGREGVAKYYLETRAQQSVVMLVESKNWGLVFSGLSILCQLAAANANIHLGHLREKVEAFWMTPETARMLKGNSVLAATVDFLPLVHEPALKVFAL